jgi:hypothetical protein
LLSTIGPLTYSPLSHDYRGIRVITIVPSQEPPTPIQCKTHKTFLNGSPGFLALSYTWGDPAVTTPILLDNIETQVSTSLEAALRHIGLPKVLPKELPCWIDAIASTSPIRLSGANRSSLCKTYTLRPR